MEIEHKKPAKKSERMEIRLNPENKKILESIAKKFGVPKSEVITSFIENQPLVDMNEKKERFAAINSLSKEINYIGKNINQITIALRQIRSDNKIEDGEFRLIAVQLLRYNESRDKISELIRETLF